MSSLISTIKKLIRIVLYLRVSTEEQARSGMSLGDQRQEGEGKARELAAELGAELELYVFEDHHGGDILDRPVLEDMRTFIRETKPDYFICLDPNRFSRSLKLQLIVADEIEDAGTRIVFVMQDYDPNDMMSRAFFQFRGLMAELDKAKILDQTMRGKRQKLRKGELANGVMIFGYDYDTQKGGLVVNETEARWVRLIFTWVREGLGPELIARRLEENGVPTKRGGQWRRGVVATMLKNTTYIGLMVANRKDTRGLDAQRRLPKERRKVKITPKNRAESEWVRLPVPAIVGEQEFAEVQSVRAGFKRTVRRGVGLLSGLVNCHLCGAPMTYQPAKGGYNLLRCVNRYPKERGSRAPAERCRQPHQHAAPIEEYVWEQIERWLTNPVSLETYIRERRQVAPEEEPTKALEEELVAIREQLQQKKEEQARILYVVAKGLVHLEVSEPQLATLNAEITGLARREANLAARLDSLRSTRTVNVEAFQNHLDQLRTTLRLQTDQVKARMASLEGLERQELVRRLIARVEVRTDGTCELVPVEV